jgi:RNA polymerase sigma-70 factor (ECF subfamily)
VPLESDVEATPPPAEDEDRSGIEDDRLRLLFICCHPALPADSRAALALRTLGGLTTREIARAFVEPEATTAQRLVRAKKKIRDARIPYEVPPREKLGERVESVLSVLYLIFNEGYASTDAPSLLRPDLVGEAIRLARLSVALLPGEPEARGLLALMLLTDSRRQARMSSDGGLIPLDAQDRSLWDRSQIDEGVRILDEALARGTPGPYQVQAAIAALHATARTSDDTDWKQISTLYMTLLKSTPSPVVELNAAVAFGLAMSLDDALAWIERLESEATLARYHLLPASKADVLRRLGRLDEAAAAYEQALTLVTNPAERLYLQKRLSSCLI